MNRIDKRFTALKNHNSKALVPFIVGGDPACVSISDLMHILVKNGADLIELGVPFSDPMADGPVIQAAYDRAIAQKTGILQLLDEVSRFRQEDDETPVVLMGYLNSVYHIGIETFAAKACAAGVDALLCVDAPYEESARLQKALEDQGLHQIFLVAPTTPTGRLDKILPMAGGFLYYVSMKGITGTRDVDTASVAEAIAAIQSRTELPLAVGFGIKNADSARKVASFADAVVIGSALVARLADARDKAQVEVAVQEFMQPIKAALSA